MAIKTLEHKKIHKQVNRFEGLAWEISVLDEEVEHGGLRLSMSIDEKSTTMFLRWGFGLLVDGFKLGDLESLIDLSLLSFFFLIFLFFNSCPSLFL